MLQYSFFLLIIMLWYITPYGLDNTTGQFLSVHIPVHTVQGPMPPKDPAFHIHTSRAHARTPTSMRTVSNDGSHQSTYLTYAPLFGTVQVALFELRRSPSLSTKACFSSFCKALL
jgi:hypothetical protein